MKRTIAYVSCAFVLSVVSGCATTKDIGDARDAVIQTQANHANLDGLLHETTHKEIAKVDEKVNKMMTAEQRQEVEKAIEQRSREIEARIDGLHRVLDGQIKETIDEANRKLAESPGNKLARTMGVAADKLVDAVTKGMLEPNYVSNTIGHYLTRDEGAAVLERTLSLPELRKELERQKLEMAATGSLVGGVKTEVDKVGNSVERIELEAKAGQKGLDEKLASLKETTYEKLSAISTENLKRLEDLKANESGFRAELAKQAKLTEDEMKDLEGLSVEDILALLGALVGGGLASRFGPSRSKKQIDELGREVEDALERAKKAELGVAGTLSKDQLLSVMTDALKLSQGTNK